MTLIRSTGHFLCAFFYRMRQSVKSTKKLDGVDSRPADWAMYFHCLCLLRVSHPKQHCQVSHGFIWMGSAQAPFTRSPVWVSQQILPHLQAISRSCWEKGKKICSQTSERFGPNVWSPLVVLYQYIEWGWDWNIQKKKSWKRISGFRSWQSSLEMADLNQE